MRDVAAFAQGGGPQDAAFNGTYQAPACLTVGTSCDTNALVDGRANLGPETNQPNTINDSCADGTSGSYHSDESNDRIVVSTLDSGNFSEGDTVQIDATVYAWSTGADDTADTADFFYAADASNPSWTLITSVTPSAGGTQTLSAQYTLPAGGVQAVRVQFRYQSTNAACAAGNYNDRDDLVFAVEGGGGGCTSDLECSNGLYCDGAPASASRAPRPTATTASAAPSTPATSRPTHATTSPTTACALALYSLLFPWAPDRSLRQGGGCTPCGRFRHPVMATKAARLRICRNL